MDRISNLPDELIRHIESFLSAKEAVFTKILSKRWFNLITIVQDLAFDDSMHGSFQVFVDGLPKRCPGERIKKFSLKLRPADFDSAQYKLVNDCLRNVLKRGVMDLELDINVKEDYSLPVEFFTCSTVVKLKLGTGFVIDFIPKNALLPALKTLLLDSFRFKNLGDGCVFQKLISACPVLEELVIDGFNCEYWNWSRMVSSQILKRLTIRRPYTDIYEGSDFETISFDTPSLVYLEYADVFQDMFPVLNLNSLVEVNLNLNMLCVRDVSDKTDLTNLFKGIKNVKILHFDSIDTGMGFGRYFKKVLPVFESVCDLFLPTEETMCWDYVEVFLDKCPKLKTLTIGDLHCGIDSKRRDLGIVCDCLSEYGFLASCPIEVLKITEFSGNIGEMVQIKHIMQKLKCLEVLEVHVKRRSHGEKKQIMSDLQMLPKASSKCKVQVMFS